MDSEAFQSDLDGWIEKLYSCKPLTEHEIKLLCEKVGKLILTGGFDHNHLYLNVRHEMC